MSEESKNAAVNALQSRLVPSLGSKGDLHSRGQASTSTLRPRGLQTSQSAAVLPGATANASASKVNLNLDERLLSKSQSAMMFNKRGLSSATVSHGGVQLNEFGEYTLDLPPVPEVYDNAGQGSGEYAGFLNTLKLSEDEKHALMHVPNTFFYMRIKSSANVPVPVNGKRAQKQTKGSSMPPLAKATGTHAGDGTMGAMEATAALAQLSVGGISEGKLDDAMGANAMIADMQSQESSQMLQSMVMSERLVHSGDAERCSVYDLEVVPQEYINPDNYFTLSKEGITIYKDRSSQFTMLSQWEREATLFNKISNIQFFAVYKRWKAFKVWKSGLRGGKMEIASNALQNSLFVLSAPLRTALLKIRATSMPMASLGILSMPPGEVFDVDNFVKAQTVVQDNLRLKLDELSTIVLTSAREACDQVVDQFLKSNNIAANHKMTFMERAALRSECRRLTRFLRMVDTMMTDFLMTMIREAMEKLVHAHELGSTVPRTEMADDMTAKLLVLKRKENKWKAPLFRVEANFRKDAPPTVHVGENGEETEEKVFEGMTLSPTQDKLTRCVDQVIANCCDVVCSFVKVLASSETEMYVMPEGDDEENDDDEGVDLATTIRQTPFFVKSKDLIHRYIRYNYNAIHDYCTTFDPFRAMYFENERYQGDIQDTFALGSVEAFEKAIKFYKDQISRFSLAPRFADVGAIMVDTATMKTEMTPSPINCINAIKNWLPKLAGKRAQILLDKVGDMNPVIGGDPKSVESYVSKKKTKDTASNELDDYKDQQSYINSLIFVMDDNNWPIPDAVKATLRMLKEGLEVLEKNIVTADGKEEDDAKRFAASVTAECPEIIKKIGEVREGLDNKIIGDPTASDEKVLKYLNACKNDFQKYKARSEKLQEYQGILRLNVDEFEVLEEVNADLNLKLRLWTDKAEWGSMRDKVMNTQINGLDVKSLEKDLERFNRTVFLSGKGLPTNKVVPKLKESVEEFNPVLPLVTDLGSKCLKDRHWNQITELVQVDIRAGKAQEPPPRPDNYDDMNEDDKEACDLQREKDTPPNTPFTVIDLIEKGITQYQTEVQAIATSAQQESILEEMMLKVTSQWETLDFNVLNYKDIKDLYVLGDTSDVTIALDDSLVTINTVLGSRYVGGIREFVDTWRSKLMHFQETLDEWQTCQRNWMYLEVIFGSPDIIRQLPGPAKTFQAVDKSWKYIMKMTNDDSNALMCGTKDRGRLDVFRQHNANLDQIQKDLEEYLETKRMAFPRFYFLSNDELLEILSQAKEPRAVQPHLRKCFDNLIKLEFGSEEGSVDLLAMFSGEGERVGLGKNLKARGNVEEWLTMVEKRMKESLHIAMKAGLHDYDTKARDEWIHLHPGQIVATVAQMTWARDTEVALRGENEGSAKDMAAWSVVYKGELHKLILLIRGNLNKLARMIIVALVTTDVHARDIIDDLREGNIESPHDFLWQQQLRYYWKTDVDDCRISHSDAVINYGYEYMGATSRLVITPLTDRCWLTLTGSYALKLGAAPAGPAGTGKTESSKDLAKAIGIQCVVFNCSDQIDYKMMGKLFRGLAQGGMWVCLDEFNRIDIEVLSVIAQQLLTLRVGRQAFLPTINFMGITIPLVDHHVIITMNPGYAGRTELPDNLQVCFRPVSMMVPNYALIAEIMLFAEGFGDAKNLSRKMCKLYILCSEQLSQQPHYDYGLRAVKSVLVMAGGLKRSNPDLEEELVLIRALRDSNVPKFLADDLPLFAAIVQDLFPGVEIPPNEYGELLVALEEEIVKAGLQKVPKFIGKVIQMFDIFCIRFGATIVGPAATGKSSIYRILAAFMTNLREKGSKNELFQKVKFQILNPKSIAMGELYGEFHPLTQEWHDGLVPSIFREYVLEESNDKRWTVFDGPIDALWIENMNTVLDDNMTLCLANGQRIKLKSEMKCLFEVNDLAVASPATVSRIGVVYVTPTDLGWYPYVESWVVREFPDDQFPAFIQPRVLNFFKVYFAKGLAFQRKFGSEPVESVDIALVISTCTLFKSLFNIDNGVNFALPEAALQNLMDKIYVFSFVWCVGACCVKEFWEQFGEYTRELFDEACPGLGLPGAGTPFDYYVDTKDCVFRDWSEMVEKFVFDPNALYFDLMVPTTDTTRFSYIMTNLIRVDKPCFITGVTGTGKTVAVQKLLNSLQPMHDEGGMGIVPIFMNFSAQTHSLVVQMSIETKLEKKRKNLLGAPAGKKVVVFVDDINMPTVETYGAQPPVELLRQVLDHKGFYDRDKIFFKELENVLLFVGAAPPGGGRAVVTGRFTRHFNVLCMPEASESNLTLIFRSILSGFLATKFETDVQKLCDGTVSGTIEMYHKISAELLPTPAKFHYTFNLRDISKVFQGMLMIRPRKCAAPETWARLWVHECQRIFYDRFINVDDQNWFKKSICETMSRHLKMPMNEDDLFKKPIVFCEFLKPDADPRFYEEAPDLAKVTAVLNDQLDNYNATFPTQMNLVFFEDAMTHAVRISRVLRQPRGNAMLIGVGGSGKQSLTKISAFVSNMQCLSIEINRGYGIKEFREDIKTFMLKTGVEGKDLVFLFTDSQIVDETMLEDLNNVLNTGEVANLFPADETDRIVGDMIPVCQAANIAETRDNCLAHFVSRVRDKLHIVLCMSPVGDALRIRCRQFPSLINCTTIDWFHGWPEAALVSVAQRFLANIDLGNADVQNGVVKMCGFVHRSIETMSVTFFEELRRKIYTTPKSYLDVISLYISMLKGLQDVVEVNIDRMKVGVMKLTETNAIVETLRGELEKLAPVLKTKSAETETLLAQVAEDSAEANIVAEKVGAEEAIVTNQAKETKAVADDAQKDLDRAMPALESAVKALASLTKADITEVKSFTNPPNAVRVVMEAVCVLMGEEPKWEVSKKLLGKSDFMELLTTYDKDNIPPARLKKLRKEYVNMPEFQPELVEKVSKAGLGLCLWARAMDIYADVAKEVEPKKARLKIMNAELKVIQDELKVKQSALKQVLDKVATLTKLCDETVAEKNRLQFESDQTAARLVRAEKLTNGLNSEGVRWKEAIVTLTAEHTALIGDCFLSCACISYYGGFTGSYRETLIELWLEKAQKLQIPTSPKFILSKVLGDPVKIREWQNQGLPTDDVSVNNGILVDKCRRWPLLIDPQMQGNNWLRKKEEQNNVQITTMNDSNLLRVLEKCIRLGLPLLLEDLSEQMEPALEPILQKAIFKNGARKLIRLGDSDIDYDDQFKLYMTTKMPNPHYLPEVCIKVTIINFTVTMQGLTDQLLGDVVAAERPDIEERKVQLMLSMAEDKKQLSMLEAKILQMLSESEGNILDDEVLINTLSESKLTSIAIGERVAEAEVTEAQINETRAKYIGVATRGSIIYFVIADLGGVDPMYQYSLSYYNMLFNKCIMNSDKSSDLDTRLNNIMNYSTYVIYTSICRGLFERHKLLFSGCVCFQILRVRKEIHDIEWGICIRGPGAIDKVKQPMNPHPDLISAPAWDLLYAIEANVQYAVPKPKNDEPEEKKEKVEGVEGEELESLPNYHGFSHAQPFAGLCDHIRKKFVHPDNPDSEWTLWMKNPDIFHAPLPEPYNTTVNRFQKLLLIKALREDKLQRSISSFVADSIGQEFAESPLTSMRDIYRDLSNKTPCIFILSTGADPTGMLLRFAAENQYGDRLHIVSLGQGQGPVAKALIDKGCGNGDWVMLQNCMLAKSWLPTLDKIISDIQLRVQQEKDGTLPKGVKPIHKDFRLYLTSLPADYFPVSILQNGVKMTTEPPKGIRANLLGNFGTIIKDTDWEDMPENKVFAWKKLLVGLSFYHSQVQERRKFGPLGWNILYAFAESDFVTSVAVLKRFLTEQENLPWDALNFVTGHINYGGRVTDDWDRRTLMAILSIYMVPEILEEGYSFSKSGAYYAPPVGTRDQVMEYLAQLPSTDDPEVFGMHENANVTFNTNESLNLMDAILSLQPRAAGGGGGKTPDEVVTDLANVFEQEAPALLLTDDAGPTTFIVQPNGLLNSLAICLEQEMIKFNRLLNKMTSSLSDIKRAIRGMIVMSADLDNMYSSFINNKLPPIWEKVSFASLKSLASWVRDMNGRVSFMREWLVNGQPAAFPLPVFFFPQGFMTASLQTFARRHMEAIDGLNFEFEILRNGLQPELITEGPEDGVIVFGMYMEGARFDHETWKVADSQPGRMYDLLPAVYMKPAVNHKQAPSTYACPVYKTAVRKGVLSTTGMSTNFVVPIEFPIFEHESEQKYILAGCAALLNLTD